MKPAKIETKRSSRNSPAGWRRKIANPLAWGMILLMLLAVGGWHAWALASRPVHMIEMADELGSLGRLIGNVAATDDGTRVSYFRGTESGGGLFVCDLASGQQHLLYEDPKMEGTQPHPQFGWSPDDKLLAVHGQRDGKDVVFIMNGDSGQIETTLFSWVQDLVWLSPSSFVFYNGDLMRVDKHPDSGWGRPYRFTKAAKKVSQPSGTSPKYPPVKGLMATSPDSVAWTGRNTIWEWSFHAVAPVKLLGIPGGEIRECSYSKDSEAFLLHLRDTTGDRVANYARSSQELVNLGGNIDSNAFNMLWVNHGKGYAYLLNQPGLHSIMLKAACTNDQPVQRVPQDGGRAMTTGGNCIYAIGSVMSQPEGIVEYDATTGAARYAAPSQAHFQYARNVTPVSGFLTNSLGEIHAYNLWAPVHFDSRKKYPLILAQQIHVWNEYAETSANAGAYYVNVERPDFNHPQIQQWADDVMAAYRLMSDNPNIDTNRVFLCGASAETGYLAQLMTQEPGLWKGAILTSAVAFPALSQISADKLLINCGLADEYNTFGGIKQFQEDAARAGIVVTLAIHRTGHVFVSASANQESTQEFIKFLFE
jgi:hypothetical protein